MAGQGEGFVVGKVEAAGLVAVVEVEPGGVAVVGAPEGDVEACAQAPGDAEIGVGGGGLVGGACNVDQRVSGSDAEFEVKGGQGVAEEAVGEQGQVEGVQAEGEADAVQGDVGVVAGDVVVVVSQAGIAEVHREAVADAGVEAPVLVEFVLVEKAESGAEAVFNEGAVESLLARGGSGALEERRDGRFGSLRGLLCEGSGQDGEK